jgi:stage V sporulation protein G
MEITEIRVKLINNKDERLKAFCSMTIDNDFVVRDIKVIEGTNGHFVAMPSRKMSDHCPKCGGKNHLRARFCNNCGASLNEDRAKKDFKGRMKLHADIAHPINAECIQFLQDKIVRAFEEEVEKSKQPGYKPVEFDEPDDDVPDEASGH